MTHIIRTIITVGQPDDPANTYHVELKGDVLETEAVHRARLVIRANDRLDHPTRGYLVSCMDNGNYTITNETADTTTTAE